MPKFALQCEKRVAYDSPDHLQPHGTRHDNSANLLFNRKLAALLARPAIAVLDLGCSGGGFVKSLIDEGQTAVGLEGSDYSQRNRRAEWATIPDNLFTCDATADFAITQDDQPAQFDAVTAWEFIEHIKTDDLPKVCRNVQKHLKPGGIWVMSVSPNEEVIEGVTLHQTVQPREWWIEFFASQGLRNHPELVDYFGIDWVRGPFQFAPGSFHLVLARTEDEAPKPRSSFPYSAADLIKTVDAFLARGNVGYPLRIFEDADVAGQFAGDLQFHLAHMRLANAIGLRQRAASAARKALAIDSSNAESRQIQQAAAATEARRHPPRPGRAKPKFSVITPAFNCGPFIEKTIQSILAQTYDNFEHIVMDAGSKDQTVDVLQKYPHIRWTSEPDRGEGDALNKAIKQVTGDIVLWLNADDWEEPGVFERVADELDPDAGRHVVYGNTYMVNDDLVFMWLKQSAPQMNLEFLVRYWRNAQQPHQPSTFYSRQLVNDVGPFNDALHFSIDFEYWLRAAVKYRFHHVDMVMSTMRNRTNSKSIDTVPKQIASHWRVLLPFHRHLNSQQRIAFWQEYYQYLLQVLGSDRQDPMPPVTQEAVIGLSRFIAAANNPQATEALVGYLHEQLATNPGTQELSRHARESVGNPRFAFNADPTASATAQRG